MCQAVRVLAIPDLWLWNTVSGSAATLTFHEGNTATMRACVRNKRNDAPFGAATWREVGVAAGGVPRGLGPLGLHRLGRATADIFPKGVTDAQHWQHRLVSSPRPRKVAGSSRGGHRGIRCGRL